MRSIFYNLKEILVIFGFYWHLLNRSVPYSNDKKVIIPLAGLKNMSLNLSRSIFSRDKGPRSHFIHSSFYFGKHAQTRGSPNRWDGGLTLSPFVMWHLPLQGLIEKQLETAVGV